MNYFGKEQEQAINKLINSNCTKAEIAGLFDDILNPALKKMVMAILNKYNQNGTQHYKLWLDDTLQHLRFKIFFFTPEKRNKNGSYSKAYSFLTVCAHNYIRTLLKINNKNTNISLSGNIKQDFHHEESKIKDINEKDWYNNQLLTNYDYQQYGEENEDTEFRDYICQYLTDYLIHDCKNDIERQFFHAIIRILINLNTIDIFNKTQFFRVIRSMTTLNKKEITEMKQKLEDIYTDIKYKYYNNKYEN